ncbi:phage tail tape measure protein, TP901 family [Mycolicibacterium vanbaalenii PYR-1]|uniref:Phage tail tape measure protein, TP901 family n=2 Tax=Mycolicibacterium vanbaalenii TaxID=110539 RepID=A1T540_MYCVP|nr:phage tail tape measure protein [Mycolicibacterium vanbaalenii]ABM12290.1 phage tail tape measure protein, TP901 family [Mycolicibacterium vanbaalenii PYR-1]
MPITLKVEAQADNRSFKQAADQAERVFADAGKAASGSFAKAFGEGSKEVKQATSQAVKAYDAVADAVGKATVAEKQRQQAVAKSEDLAKKAAAAEKKLNSARDAGDTKAVASAEKELERVRDQQARTTMQVVRSADAASRARRQEQRETREAVQAYRELQNAQVRASQSGGSTRMAGGLLSGITSQSSGVVGQFTSLGGSAGKAFIGGAVAAIVAGGLVSAGAKAAGMVLDGFKSVLDTGIDFSKTVNSFQGVTESSPAQTERMAAAARALGADTTMAGVSASDAARAMTELAKAGFSVDEAISSARGTMQLATAAEIDAAEAAEIQANAINAFGLSADDAAHVADVLANAAVGSAADIPDLALALQQVGGIAQGFGEDIEGTVAAIAMLADVGIKGSDAGTLLKTTLQSITKQGDPARDAMEALGLSLYNLDTGQFVGFREMFRQLDEARARLRPQDFQAQTNILFGSDAMRSAMLGTVADFDTMEATINRVGTAGDMARAKMQGWPGIMEGINNTIGELKLSLFDDIFNTPAGQEFGNKIVESLDGLVEWVNTHKPEIIGFVAAIGSAGASIADTFLMFGARIMDTGATMIDFVNMVFTSMIEGGSKTAQLFGGIIKHIPGFQSVGEGIEDMGAKFDGWADKLQALPGQMRTAANGLDSFRDGIRGMRDDFVGSMGEMALAEQKNRFYAQSFKQIQSAVELIPETKQIVVADNSPEVKQKLIQLGFAVQTLPNGKLVINVEYRDPSGKLVDPSQLGVSQRQLDDRDSRQHDWGIDPPAGPAPLGTQSIPAGGGSSSLPDAPVLPINYTNTAGMTAELASAQSRVDETRHTLAEKQARLNQLLESGVADEAEIQKARNDVAKAGQDANEAQMRFVDAQRKVSEKQSNQLKGATTDLNEFGAQLDSDFGISKGLAGIADNLVRFLGALALAGPVAKLQQISDAAGDEGSGLMGILASNGAFGPQFMPGAGRGSSYVGTPYGSAGIPRGGAPTEDQVKQIAAAFGLQVTSEDRPGDPGYHGQGMALDVSNGSGNTPQMREFAEYMSTNFGSSLKELIYSDGSFSGLIGDGKNVTGTGYYDSGTLAEHQNHVHVAADWGGSALQSSGGPVPVNVVNGGSIAAPLTSAIGQWSADWNAIAQAESGGNWSINTGNGYSGGLQFSPSSWAAAGGTQYAPSAYQASPYQQALTAERLLAMQGPGAWPNTFVPGSTGPSPDAVGPAGPLPSFIPGGAAGGPLGTGFPQGLPGLGGQAYPAQGGEGGVGMGGMAMDAAMLGTSALDMMAPGAGAAAKVGIQLANRTIKYAGQVAGIGVSGLLETFSPAGDNPKASIGNSWLGKIMGGLAGAAPSLPNMAGGKKPDAINGGDAQAGGKAGGNTVSITNNLTNNHATEDMVGNQLVREQAAMYTQSGVQ